MIRSQLPALLPHLTAFSRHLLRDRSKCEDLVHDTIVRALEREHLFDGCDLKSWLFTIMRHTVCNEARRKPQIPTDPTNEIFLRLESPSAQEAAIELAEVRRAMAGLSRSHQEVLRSAAHNDGGDGRNSEYADIAADLGVCIGTVRSRLSRARAALRAVA